MSLDLTTYHCRLEAEHREEMQLERPLAKIELLTTDVIKYMDKLEQAKNSRSETIEDFTLQVLYTGSVSYTHLDVYKRQPLLNVGLAAGYRLPLDKKQRWCLEFSLGVGYASLNYDRFFNIPNGAYVDTRHGNFFGIDHAGISVGYRIDWKGGGR